MGALLTYCVIKTNSIITGMLIHLSINGTQVVMANVVQGEFTLPPYAFFISLIILAGGLYLLPERRKIVTKEVAHGDAGD
jgi:membrane protease YdiL (CAAX protease family)